ncbi:MAG: OmpA family protein, partial [Hyphomicrobiales bacterium]|nr:OmpA family protein [Hyphomicrobiales bacterium]
ARQENQGERLENKQERREDKREFQGEKRDARQDFQGEKQENKQDRRDDKREFKDDKRDARQDFRNDSPDNKQERREDKREFKDEKRDARQDYQGEKLDNKQDRRDDKRELKDDKRDARQDFREDRREDRRENRQDFLKAREERKEKRKGLDEVIRREKQDSRDERRQDRVQDRLRRVDERLGGLRAARRERREGDRIIIDEPDSRRIVRQNNRVIIRGDENIRLRRKYRDVREERRGGEIFTEFRRPNGTVIVTVTGEDGRVLRRLRRFGGRESILFNNAPRRGGGYYEDSFVDLPPLRRSIARDRYIVEADEASEEDIEDALSAGPLEDLERGYNLDEVRSSIRLRERMRSVDLDSITFDFGSWELGNSQFARLESVAEVLKGIIERNADEVFLIEGHTDAVGSDDDNLSLSDRRAETIANVLQDEFNVPAENLVTQGYGEQFLKIETDEPERENRRVTVRRVTPLLNGNDDRVSDRR